MKRGVVLEIRAKSVTLLTPNGEFLISKKVRDQYEIGEEVEYFPVNGYSSFNKTFFSFDKLRMTLASSVAAVLLFLAIFTIYDGQEVYAYMSIDINPSFEAGVDKDLRVVSLEAYNDEGERVLENLKEWRNQPVQIVATAIIQGSKDSGYYHDGAEIIIATVIIEQDEETVTQKLNSNIQGLVQNYEEVNVPITVLNSSVQSRELARQEGISVGKYVSETIPKKERDKDKNDNTNNKDKDSLNNNSKDKKELSKEQIEVKKEIENITKDKSDKKDNPKSNNDSKDKVKTDSKEDGKKQSNIKDSTNKVKEPIKQIKEEKLKSINEKLEGKKEKD